MVEVDTFADPAIAQRTRDAVARLMIKVIDQERPPYKYGVVDSIDPGGHFCMVVLETGQLPVEVAFGGSRPTQVGQVVRVEGRRGDRFIADVIGGAIPSDPAPVDLGVPANFDMGSTPTGVRSHWDNVNGAVKYELQHADNAGMSVNARSYTTISNEFIEYNLTSGSTVYGRVRALTSYGAAGPWSSVDSTTAGFSVGGTPSDGAVPTSSPTAVITPALGFILVEWLPISNNDPVTYEVHISTTNGFTPSGATLIGQTSGTFFTVRQDAANVNLVYGTTYFFRLIAKDKDGAAAAGGQGSGSMTKFGALDVSQIPLGSIGDGVPPTSSPAPVVTNGIGYLFIKWDKLVVFDYTVYDVHVSSVNGFTPSSATLVGGTTDDFFFIRKQGTGAGSAALVYGVTYYVKIVARDVDGVAAASAQATGTPVQATTPDLAVGAITAGSGIIGNLAVDTAQIAAAAITNAKIGALAVSQAQIQLLAVDTAQIANLAVDNGKIGALAVTNAKINDLAANKITAGTIASQTIILGSGGQFKGGNAPSGAGFLLNDQGFSLYNASAVRTLYADATNGNVTITGGTITSAYFRTAVSGARLEINAGGAARIDYWTALPGEVDNGYLYWDTINSGAAWRKGRVILAPAQMRGTVQDFFNHPFLDMFSASQDGVGYSSLHLGAAGSFLKMAIDNDTLRDVHLHSERELHLSGDNGVQVDGTLRVAGDLFGISGSGNGLQFRDNSNNVISFDIITGDLWINVNGIGYYVATL